MSAPITEPFVHEALLYEDTDEYLAGTVPFITAGLAEGEPVAVAVPAPRLDQIRSALGADANRVVLRDMSLAGRNPGRIIPGVLLAFASLYPNQRVRIIGEPIFPGRTSDEYPACAQHEALLNAAFAGRDATILCPYDLSALDPIWLDDALCTHPVVVTPTRRWESLRYGDPVEVAAGFNEALPEAPPHAFRANIALDGLADLRQRVTDEALAAGLSPEKALDFVLAANELASNTIAHTSGAGTLAVWSDEEYVMCQVNDGGHIDNPLAGRIPVAAASSEGGRGLLLVHHVCDLVRVHTIEGATAIRVYLARD
jgi:anti-sigma regulatory factor (Ser/Thr protein kinase)